MGQSGGSGPDEARIAALETEVAALETEVQAIKDRAAAEAAKAVTTAQDVARAVAGTAV